MTRAYHHAMKSRDSMNAVIEGLQNEAPKPANVEAHQVSTAPQLPEVVPSTSPFVFRRANLLRAP
jgi:hypothetical protein